MSKIVKRLIAGTVAAALTCGGIYGGLITYRNTNAAEVAVYAVSDILSSSYFYDDSESTAYGSVSSDRMQSVFLSNTQKVKEIKVTQGQNVKKGDVLMTYDTTLNELTVQKAANELAQQQLSLKRMTEDLTKLKTLKPSASAGEGGGDYGGGDYGGEEPDSYAESVPESEPESERELNPMQTPHLIRGTGTINDPYVFLWSIDDVLSNQRLLWLMAGSNAVNVPESSEEESESIGSVPDSESQTIFDGDDQDAQVDPTESQASDQDTILDDDPIDANDTETPSSDDVPFADGNTDDLDGYADDDGGNVPTSESVISTWDGGTDSSAYSSPSTGGDGTFVNDDATGADGGSQFTAEDEAAFDAEDAAFGGIEADQGTTDSFWDSSVTSFIIHAAIPRFSDATDDAEGSGTVTANDDTDAAPEEVDVETSGSGNGSTESGIQLDSLPDGVYVVLENRKYNNAEGDLITSYGMHLYRSGKDVSVQLYNPNADSEEEQTDDPAVPDDEEPTDSTAESFSEGADGGYYGGGDYSGGYEGGDEGSGSSDGESEGTSSTVSIYQSDIDWNGAYTAKEIAQMLLQKAKDVRDLTITVKKAEISLRNMRAELNDGSVRAKFDGVIKTIRDADDAQQSNSAVVVLSGGGGYYATIPIGELDLDTIQKGQQVQVQSMDMTTMYSGTITEISEYPTNNSDAYSNGNPNVSYYPATIQMESDAEMMDGDYVSVTISASGQALTGLFLDKMFIRSEDGQRYVYIRDENGLLKRQNIVTGRTIWDTYTQVTAGITSESCVAFPYGSDVKEGAKTTVEGYADFGNG